MVAFVEIQIITFHVTKHHKLDPKQSNQYKSLANIFE